jgi:hypothetical protein
MKRNDEVRIKKISWVEGEEGEAFQRAAAI